MEVVRIRTDTAGSTFLLRVLTGFHLLRSLAGVSLSFVLIALYSCLGSWMDEGLKVLSRGILVCAAHLLQRSA